jgi:hypothetical protein
MRSLLPLLVLALVGFAGLVYVASEYGGEVVTLRTEDADGRVYETHVWIVDDGNTQWLRAGSATSHWYKRLVDNPEVEVERDGISHRYEALPMASATAHVNDLMALRYGWADWVISWVRDPENCVAIRLDPLPDEG